MDNLVHGGIQIEGGQAELNHNLAARLDEYFVDPASGNPALTLAATGAIDKGVALQEVPRDIRGAPRKNAPDIGAWEYGDDKEAWVEPMRKVHARFNGTPGTFAQFGDSITYSGAFWSPLAAKPKNMSPTAAEAYQLENASETGMPESERTFLRESGIDDDPLGARECFQLARKPESRSGRHYVRKQ
jgi:hypothetical protein